MAVLLQPAVQPAFGVQEVLPQNPHQKSSTTAQKAWNIFTATLPLLIGIGFGVALGGATFGFSTHLGSLLAMGGFGALGGAVGAVANQLFSPKEKRESEEPEILRVPAYAPPPAFTTPILTPHPVPSAPEPEHPFAGIPGAGANTGSSAHLSQVHRQTHGPAIRRIDD